MPQGDYHATWSIFYQFSGKGYQGFQVIHGDITQNWLILKNADTTIGIFQGMFENYILTFNPGWDSDANELEKFTDIR
jgi:hypothetical protein